MRNGRSPRRNAWPREDGSRARGRGSDGAGMPTLRPAPRRRDRLPPLSEAPAAAASEDRSRGLRGRLGEARKETTLGRGGDQRKNGDAFRLGRRPRGIGRGCSDQQEGSIREAGLSGGPSRSLLFFSRDPGGEENEGNLRRATPATGRDGLKLLTFKGL